MAWSTDLVCAAAALLHAIDRRLRHRQPSPSVSKRSNCVCTVHTHAVYMYLGIHTQVTLPVWRRGPLARTKVQNAKMHCRIHWC
ncbi:hypothetical protein PF005_g3531 [Phytophthora fragariae]|uniref:Uncharacterized protein n=1 Tax=Phytophthora fragariae TaxID=53985 RepID=A0A6A3FK95_9STRA|nr:hypothetical protein PF003_g14565 [Phytophthora fragariae]KAE8946474.1 hypothetical protein PF009_g3895 [Phytophthora fragariae]KAE9132986.1 hypothetical protein PF007_g3513 [Phytophthora fragariae]KAE9152699.1 hypothetical protein PF006_g3090 [Phytophthora fragariae]KAE9230289.1 hypothetical protein PF005_g3531 [Phytophthora fragariae]